MSFKATDSGLEIRVDGNIYDMDVLHKCFYWYGGTYNVEITKDMGHNVIILTKKVDSDIELNFDLLIEKIQRDLVDFKLRNIVTKETQTIRELIVAKAFAYFDTEDNPTSDISDPVGFIPESIKS